MDKYFHANAVPSIFSKSYMELKKDLPIRPSEMGVLNIITKTPDSQSGSMFMRDRVNIDARNLNKQIACAEEIQHELEKMFLATSMKTVLIKKLKYWH